MVPDFPCHSATQPNVPRDSLTPLTEDSTPIQAAIDAGVVPPLVKLLGNDGSSAQLLVRRVCIVHCRWRLFAVRR